jgi:hypothetical protein
VRVSPALLPYGTGTAPTLAPAAVDGPAVLALPGSYGGREVVAELFQDDAPGAVPVVSLWTAEALDAELSPAGLDALLYRLDRFRARLAALRDDLAAARRP